MRPMSRHVRNPALIASGRPLPKAVGVIGAGTIGPDIGYYLKSAIEGLTLVLIDIRDDALTRAVDRIEAYAAKGVARGKLSEARASDVRNGIVCSTDYAALADCDWVIEAATENIELKKQIFSDVEAVVGADCLITSNTSSIPAERLFSHLEHPERATVTHFFAPAFRNPIVEVVDWSGAAPATVDDLRALFYRTDKVPLVTTDDVCFMLDRIFDNWCNEAALLTDLASPAEIDTVAAEFVHAGPFFVLNLANGNPIIVETNTLQMEVEGEHYRPAEILLTAGRWDTVNPGESVPVDAERHRAIRERLLGVLFSQAYDILDRAIGTPGDLELGCRLAFAFKAGPLALASRLGDDEVTRILAAFERDRPGMPVPRRPVGDYQTFDRDVLVDALEGGIRLVTIRRPEALNALHDGLTDEILALLRRFETDPDVTGVILTGYGPRAFSAGADIGRFPSMLGDHAASIDYARSCSRLLVALDAYPKPVVAALNGMALGGGLELAMRCHGIVASDNAWMQFPEITLGIAPGIGAMVVPYRRWPEHAPLFHRMLLTAEPLDAATAKDHGIVAEVVPQAELITSAIAELGRVARDGYRLCDSPVSIAAAEPPEAPHQAADGRRLPVETGAIVARAINAAAAARTLDDALEVGYRAFGDSALTAAAREGITAFGERRAPDFTGL